MYVKRISVKLIFGKYASLDWGNCFKIKAALVANKDDLNKEKDIRANIRQLRNKK